MEVDKLPNVDDVVDDSVRVARLDAVERDAVDGRVELRGLEEAEDVDNRRRTEKLEEDERDAMEDNVEIERLEESDSDGEVDGGTMELDVVGRMLYRFNLCPAPHSSPLFPGH